MVGSPSGGGGIAFELTDIQISDVVLSVPTRGCKHQPLYCRSGTSGFPVLWWPRQGVRQFLFATRWRRP